MRAGIWQVHRDGPADGRFNMAKDALLLRRAATEGVASLRLYAWDRLTLSVGRAQKVERQVDLEACAALGIPVVRRETGGRAVLHGSDITYAIAAPLNDAQFQGGILAIYREISRAFLHFFAGLGLGPQAKAYTGRERAETVSPVCFVTPSAFEILLGGRKIVGSAQRQIPGAFLQHGSIPLEPQQDLLARIFVAADAARIAEQMTDLRSAGALPALGVDELRTRLLQSFGAVFDIGLESADWTHADRQEAEARRADFPWLEAAGPSTPPSPPRSGRPAAR